MKISAEAKNDAQQEFLIDTLLDAAVAYENEMFTWRCEAAKVVLQKARADLNQYINDLRGNK